MTRNLFGILSALCWLTAFICGFLPLAWHADQQDFNEKLCDFVLTMKLEYLQFLQLPGFFLVVFFILAMFCRIFYIAYRSAERRRVRTNDPCTEVTTNRERQSLKITKTCTLVAGTFLICWMPFMVTSTIQIYTENLYNETLLNLRTVFTFVAMCNSAMNPVIYAAR